MMKALLEGLTPSDFDITPDCSQATPPRHASQLPIGGRTPQGTSHRVTASSTRPTRDVRLNIAPTSRSTTRHVDIYLSPERPARRNLGFSSDTDPIAPLGLSEARDVKRHKVLSPTKMTSPTRRLSVKTKAPRSEPLLSSLNLVLDEAVNVSGRSINTKFPNTPERNSSTTPPPPPERSAPIVEDVCLPPASQETVYDDNWDLDALANMDEADLIKPAVAVSPSFALLMTDFTRSSTLSPTLLFPILQKDMRRHRGPDSQWRACMRGSWKPSVARQPEWSFTSSRSSLPPLPVRDASCS